MIKGEQERVGTIFDIRIGRREVLLRAAVITGISAGLGLGAFEAARRLDFPSAVVVEASDLPHSPEVQANPETRTDIGVPEELLMAGGKALCFLDGRGSQKEGLFIGSLGGSELVWNKVQLDGMGALREGALDQCALAPSPNGELFLGMRAEGQLTRMYKSPDNGEGWILLNNGKPIEDFPGLQDLAVDPNNPQRIYAGGWICGEGGTIPGLMESIDGGENWHLLPCEFLYSPDDIIVHPENSDLFVLDGSTWGIYTGERQLDGSFVWSKIFHCTSPDHLVLNPQNPEAMVFSFDNQIIFTEDKGKTWNETWIPDVEGEKDRIRSLVFGLNGKLWIGTRYGKLYSTIDRRSLVSAGREGLPSGKHNICPIAVNPANPNELLIGLMEWGPDIMTVWKAVYHSKDGGNSWQPANNFEGETEPTPTPSPTPTSTPTPPPTFKIYFPNIFKNQ